MYLDVYKSLTYAYTYIYKIHVSIYIYIYLFTYAYFISTVIQLGIIQWSSTPEEAEIGWCGGRSQGPAFWWYIGSVTGWCSIRSISDLSHHIGAIHKSNVCSSFLLVSNAFEYLQVYGQYNWFFEYQKNTYIYVHIKKILYLYKYIYIFQKTSFPLSIHPYTVNTSSIYTNNPSGQIVGFEQWVWKGLVTHGYGWDVWCAILGAQGLGPPGRILGVNVALI